MKKVDILAIGAHPDDVELSAAGTLLKHAAAGKTFGLLDLTKGELGSRGTAEIRAEEAANSAKLLGAEFRETLDLGDGFFTWNDENLCEIIRVIRAAQPEIVLCNAPDDRHPDHGRAAKLAADACFFAGLAKIETFNDLERQKPWRPRAVYHYIQDKQLEPDFVVDITPFFEKKIAAILTFRSQFFSENEPGGPTTPISGKDFMDFMAAKMRVFGRPIGAEYAEGFIFTKTPGVDNLFVLK